MKYVILTVIIGLSLMLVSSCDLFSTRPTEPPFDPGSAWIYPTQVDQVFENMKQAIVDVNGDHYMRCFFTPDDTLETYLFIPNPNTIWPLSVPWGYDEEYQAIDYLFSLLSTGSPGFLSFLSEGELVYGNEDSVWVTKSYTMVVPVSDPLLPQEVRGRADFYLAKNGTGYWAIYRWEDIENLEGYASWTDLKAGLY
jgi:hypothetical protein